LRDWKLERRNPRGYSTNDGWPKQKGRIVFGQLLKCALDLLMIRSSVALRFCEPREAL
jgi:hypothetical protein